MRALLSLAFVFALPVEATLITIDPSLYAPGTDLSNVGAGVTLSTYTNRLSWVEPISEPVFAVQGFTGDRVSYSVTSLMAQISDRCRTPSTVLQTSTTMRFVFRAVSSARF